VAKDSLKSDPCQQSFEFVVKSLHLTSYESVPKLPQLVTANGIDRFDIELL
jgi:hypothetical protein